MTMKILKHDANIKLLIKKTKFLRKKARTWCTGFSGAVYRT